MTAPEKLLPQNLDAETAALGSILIDTGSVPRARPIVGAEDFYREAHRQIYAVMDALDRAGEPVDIISVTDELARTGKLDTCGGISYVTSLANNVPTSAHLEYYCRVVAEKATLRRLINAAGQIAAVAYNEPDAALALAQAGALMRQVQERSRNRVGDSVPFDVAVRNWLQGIYDSMDSGPRGIMTGFGALDAITMGFHPGEQWLVTAPTSGGKSVWALSAALTMAKRQMAAAEMGKPHGAVEYVTLEMPAAAHVQRCIAAWTNTNGRVLRADFWDGPRFNEQLFHEVEPEALRLADAVKGYLRFYDQPMKLSALEAHLERAVDERGCPIAFVDYITLVDPELSRADDRAKVNELTWRMKQLAMRLRIPIVCLMQMNRKFDERENKRPQLTDLKNSSDAEQNADGVIGIHLPYLYDAKRAQEEPDTFGKFGELWVLKARGSLRDAWAPFRYEGEYTRCSNWDRHTYGIPADPTRPASERAA